MTTNQQLSGLLAQYWIQDGDSQWWRGTDDTWGADPTNGADPTYGIGDISLLTRHADGTWTHHWIMQPFDSGFVMGDTWHNPDDDAMYSELENAHACVPTPPPNPGVDAMRQARQKWLTMAAANN